MSKPTKKKKVQSRKKSSVFLKALGMAFYVLVLGVTLAFGSLMGWINQSEVLKNVIINRITNQEPKDVFQSNSLTVLILGCDDDVTVKNSQIVKSTARSDLMMVARLDFETNSVGAVSIPRDTLVQVAGYRRQKINAYHALGGPELAQRAVEQVLPNVAIDRVVVLNFKAFEELIDMVGGVDIYVPKRMKYDDNWANLHIDLQVGRQHLNGYEAMGFVRWRKNNNGRGGDSDFERQKRQKDLMMALKDQIVKNMSMANRVLDKTVDIAGGAFSSQQIAALMLMSRSLNGDNVKMGQIPVVEIEGSYDLRVDQLRLEDTLKEFRVVVDDGRYVRASE
ncbi:MAG: LCP family protein [Armatimonadetes bacterium]|nr:LCP family protein [Armatimonadota bacterium]